MPVPLHVHATLPISQSRGRNAVHKIVRIQVKSFSYRSHQTPEWVACDLSSFEHGTRVGSFCSNTFKSVPFPFEMLLVSVDA